MRSVAVVIFAVGCAGAAPPPPPPAPAPLQLVYVPRAVGDRFHDVQQTRFEAVGADGHLIEIYDVDCEREVRAVDGSAITSEASHYTRYLYRAERDGVPRSWTMLTGHTYVVTRVGAELTIERDDGAPLDASEHQLVAQDHLDIGSPSRSSRFVTARRWAMGQRVALDDAEQQVFFGEQKGTASLTLIEVTDELARFALRNTGRDPQGVDFDVTSTTTFDRATGRVRQRKGTSTFTGPWKGTAELLNDLTDR